MYLFPNYAEDVKFLAQSIAYNTKKLGPNKIGLKIPLTLCTKLKVPVARPKRVSIFFKFCLNTSGTIINKMRGWPEDKVKLHF